MKYTIKVFSKSGTLLIKSDIDFTQNNSITIGSSDYCNISLRKFLENGDINSVESTHLIILSQNNSLTVLSPSGKNPPKFSNGKIALEKEITPGEKIFFGDCFMIIESFEYKGNPISFLIIKKSSKIIAEYKLYNQTYSIGDANSGANLTVPFDTSGKIIMTINVTTEGILLTPISNEISSSSGSIMDKTVVDFSEQYKFREYRFCFGKDYHPNEHLSVSINSILNTAISTLFIIALSLSLYLFYHHHKISTLIPNKENDDIQLAKELSNSLNEGDIFRAIYISSMLPGKDEYKKLISLDNAISITLFFQSIVSNFESKISKDDFMDTLLSCKNPVLSLQAYSTYFNGITDELNSSFEVINATKYNNIPQLKSIKSSKIMEKIQIFKDYFASFNSLNKAWLNEDWENASNILTTLVEKSEKAGMKSFLAFFRKHIDIAKTGKRIQKLEKDLKNSNFIDNFALINKLKQEVEQIQTEIADISKSDRAAYELLKNDLQRISTNLGEAENITNIFFKWQKNQEEDPILIELISSISKLKPSEYNTLRKTLFKIAVQVSSNVEKRINAINTTGSIENLEKCDRLSSICSIILFFNPQFDTSALTEKRNKIYNELLNKCDELFAEYKNFDPNSKEAKVILSQILSYAPPDSRYKTWAEKTLKTE